LKGKTMPSYPAGPPHPDLMRVHPGEILREDVIPALGKPKAEIARLLGISRQHLYDILNEKKPITPEVAVRMGKLFGNGPDIWVRMQATHDLWHAKRKIDVSHIQTLKPVQKDAA
jgi:addiction module HigA family antidote